MGRVRTTKGSATHMGCDGPEFCEKEDWENHDEQAYNVSLHSPKCSGIHYIEKLALNSQRSTCLYFCSAEKKEAARMHSLHALLFSSYMLIKFSLGFLQLLLPARGMTEKVPNLSFCANFSQWYTVVCTCCPNKSFNTQVDFDKRYQVNQMSTEKLLSIEKIVFDGSDIYFGLFK
ncbi:hypothetical protein STEG23_024663, partial [Scotinomys teguina]